jgi:hypothetical protein
VSCPFTDKKMPAPGAATSRDPVGIFQENIVPKNGLRTQEESSFFSNFISFLINMLCPFSGARKYPFRGFL